ncbi:MAG: GNAT family N-acetyltransferase [Armatimonadota bacterium]|nr:MAG: GNAT family N-acetyltransferase [Armatimonadota bacterium]
MNDLVFAPIDEAGWRAFESWWRGNAELQRSYTPPTEAYHAYLRTDANVFGRMVYEHGEPMALVQVDLEAEGTGHVALVVRPELWNRGHGRRVLGALVKQPELSRLKRIVANVHVNHSRSQRCFAGAGFVQQGTEPDEDGFLTFVYTMATDEGGLTRAT